MRISLIGMAGAGKSYWARKLEKQGFIRFCCDEMIAEKLETELARLGPGDRSVAEWMGFPYEAHYKERERKYLELEQEVVEEVLVYLEGETNGSDVVVDTTGSFIYLEQRVIERLRSLTVVVLLSTPEEIQRKLLNDYITNPHPMVWRGMFEKRPGETPQEAMTRCYPRLFASRMALYERCAHICLDYYELREEGFEASDFLGKIRSAHVPDSNKNCS